MRKLLKWLRGPTILIYLRHGKPFHIGSTGNCKITVVIDSDDQIWLDAKNLTPMKITEKEIEKFLDEIDNPYNE